MAKKRPAKMPKPAATKRATKPAQKVSGPVVDCCSNLPELDDAECACFMRRRINMVIPSEDAVTLRRLYKKYAGKKLNNGSVVRSIEQAILFQLQEMVRGEQ